MALVLLRILLQAGRVRQRSTLSSRTRLSLPSSGAWPGPQMVRTRCTVAGYACGWLLLCWLLLSEKSRLVGQHQYWVLTCDIKLLAGTHDT